MPRKGSSGPPDRRTEEESLEPPASDQPLPGSRDAAIELEQLEEDEIEFIYGDIVQDREENEDPETMVVVNTPDETAEEWEVDDNDMLADHNPKFPRKDDVVIVVLKDELDEFDEDWDEREEEYTLDQLEEDEVDYQLFPYRRLILVEESHLRE